MLIVALAGELLQSSSDLASNIPVLSSFVPLVACVACAVAGASYIRWVRGWVVEDGCPLHCQALRAVRLSTPQLTDKCI